MADRPIIFSGAMVRALLEGRKSMTRRVLKPQPYPFNHPDNGKRTWNASGQVGGRICMSDRALLDLHRKPAPGDRLYVREACATWGRGPEREPVEFPVAYAADDPEWDAIKHDARMSKGDEWKIRPSIHMPRWASRLTLTVTDVRVQRLQDISEADAVAEGVIPIVEPDDLKWEHYAPHGVAFRDLWNSLHGPQAWDANPWVAAYSFSVQRGNIDQIGGAA